MPEKDEVVLTIKVETDGQNQRNSVVQQFQVHKKSIKSLLTDCMGLDVSSWIEVRYGGKPCQILPIPKTK